MGVKGQVFTLRGRVWSAAWCGVGRERWLLAGVAAGEAVWWSAQVESASSWVRGSVSAAGVGGDGELEYEVGGGGLLDLSLIHI